MPTMDRSGMGFAVMEAFMDSVEVTSELGVGTTVTMKKTIGSVVMGDEMTLPRSSMKRPCACLRLLKRAMKARRSYW